MFSARVVAWGVTLVSVARAVSSFPGMECCGSRVSGAPADRRDALCDSPPQELQRLAAVPGCDPSKTNDLLLLRPKTRDNSCTSSRHVVFFHGDIQNFREEMLLHSDSAPWVRWSLEEVAAVLGQRFPDSHVWVVRASRIHLHKFSCYQHFVDCNMFGAPEHSAYSPGRGAFCHLRALLSNAMDQAGLPPPLAPPEASPHPPSPPSLSLLGFSKGCVVLNQLLYELPGARADPLMSPFVGLVSDMFWLDGGHPGGSETWVTDAEALKELAASGISVHAHVTPYEVCDPMRAWVGREHGVFVSTLEELGACPSKKLHFEDESPSIENHFRVITMF